MNRINRLRGRVVGATALEMRAIPIVTAQRSDTGPQQPAEHRSAQPTNLLERVWNKAGAPLTAPFKMSSLCGPLGGICSTGNAGDPIALYDQLADRWLLSQFNFFGNGGAPPYHQGIAISTSGN